MSVDVKHTSTTVCLVDFWQSGEFFLRLAQADECRNYIIVTHLPSVWLLCLRFGLMCKLISRLHDSAEVARDMCLEQTRELKSEILTAEEANLMASSYLNVIRQLDMQYDLRNILIWNGQTVVGKVAKYCKKLYGCGNLFFEIANIPDKIFVDPLGVNCESSLFARLKDGADLPQYEDLKWFAEWKQKYLKFKRSDNVVPQAVGRDKLRPHLMLDFIFANTLGYRHYSRRSFSNKNPIIRIRKKIFEKKSKIKLEDNLNQLSEFIFYPGQVHDDTQLLLNSDIGNAEAIKIILEKTCLRVVVKPHPAGSLEEYEEFSEPIYAGRVVFTSSNTFGLIEKAKYVYTINSTVGLEALILGKKVTFMGKSIYGELNSCDIPWFVSEYLIDINFFASSQKLKPTDVEAIYSRASYP